MAFAEVPLTQEVFFSPFSLFLTLEIYLFFSVNTFVVVVVFAKI